MELPGRIEFKDLKTQIAEAIKQSCYRTDARLYNIANGIHQIPLLNTGTGTYSKDDLAKIIDCIIYDSVGVGCDLSVIVEGILLGSFRSNSFVSKEVRKPIRIFIKEVFKAVFKYKANIKESVEGVLAAIVIISIENKLNVEEVLVIAKEDIMFSAKDIDEKFALEIQEIISELDVAS